MNAPRRHLGGVLLAGAGLVAGWCLRSLLPAGAGAEDPAESEEAAPAEEMEVLVAVEPAVEGELPIVLEVVGRVAADPAASLTVSSRAGGRVLEAHGAPGSRVEQGELLVRFDLAPLEAQAAEARAARDQAAGELAEFERSGRERETLALESAARTAATEASLAAAQVQRIEPLVADGLVSERQALEARAAAQRASGESATAAQVLEGWRAAGADLHRATLAAALAAALARADDAQALLAAAEVRAPADGRIVEFAVRAGQTCEPGAPLASLLVADGRRLEFGVAPDVASRVVVGARATFEAAGVELAGRVTGIVAALEPGSGLVDVVVTPDAPSEALLPGLVVRGELETDVLRGVVLVPERALIRAEDRTAVVVAGADGRARVVPVEVLGRHRSLAAVRGELAAGAALVVAGGYNLPDGARVVVAPAAGASAAGGGPR